MCDDVGGLQICCHEIGKAFVMTLVLVGVAMNTYMLIQIVRTGEAFVATIIRAHEGCDGVEAY